jgi:hypothetical protein
VGGHLAAFSGDAMTDAAKTAGKQRGKPFEPGKSGNPAGKPRGARHAITILAEKLMNDEAEDVVKAVIQAAKNGDVPAARLVLERISPARKDRPINFDMPAIFAVADLPKATHAIMGAVSKGEITPSEASELGKLVDAHVRAIEVTDLQERIARLEEAQR